MKRILPLLLLLPLLLRGQGEVVHNVNSGSLIIPANSTSRYVLTGSTTNSNNYVRIQPGFHGTIVLRNVTMAFPGTTSVHSPIRLVGVDNQPNTDPVTDVSFILEGHNVISNVGNTAPGNHGNGRACIQVDQGTTARFSAIDPANNFSGTLCVTQADKYAGAAIGALAYPYNSQEASGVAHTSENRDVRVAGGNIVVTSGIIDAVGGHGAGLGGGHGYGSRYMQHSFYDGMILITGGIINCITLHDAAGVGSGCPIQTGLVEEHTPNSAIIALPPSVVTALGTGGNPQGGPGDILFPSLGLAGANATFYIGDTNKPLITVSTVDLLPGADIYCDLSNDATICTTIGLLADSLQTDVHRIFVGTTGADGLLQFHAQMPANTAFYTDAVSTAAGFENRPYVTASLNGGTTVVLPRVDLDIALQATPPTPLVEGYSGAEAQQEAYLVRVAYSDASTLSQFSVSLASGSDFATPTLLQNDGMTPCTANALAMGDIYYVRCPLATGLSEGHHADILLLSGYKNGTTPITLRHRIGQWVAEIDTVFSCGDTYTLGTGREVTEEGLYIDTITTTIHWEEEPQFFSCHGDVFRSPSSGEEVHSYVQASYVIFQPGIYDTIAVAACDSLLWAGEWLRAEGTYQHLFRTAAGCDSTVTMTLSLNHATYGEESLTLCYSQLPYTYHDLLLGADAADGDYTARMAEANAQGCDSVVALHLTVVRPEVRVEIVGYDCATGAVRIRAESGSPVRWSSSPQDESLAGQEGAREIVVYPQRQTTYRATAYEGDCEASAEVESGVVEAYVRASMHISPEAASMENTEIHLSDRSQGHVSSWQWWVDERLYSTEADCIYMYPVTRDSVRVRLIVAEATYGCRDTADGVIRMRKRAELWVPNAFAPDSEENPRFLAKGVYILDFEMSIYDRLGQRVFYSVDMAEGWDGGGLPEAAYTYKIRYSTLDAPRDHSVKVGTVLLLR